MFEQDKVIQIFSGIGADIISDKRVFVNGFNQAKGIIFDWDGVFTDGKKGENDNSHFSEVDAMGLNLLRFALRDRNKQMPHFFIVTGMHNPSAIQFAHRECFTAVYQGVKDKSHALQHIKDKYNIKTYELMCFFDDVLDVSMAKDCCLKFLVNRKANPLFIKYVKNKEYCDYVTAAYSGENPIREVCEFMIGLNADYNYILENRINFSPSYSEYWKERNNIKSLMFQWQNGNITEQDI